MSNDKQVDTKRYNELIEAELKLKKINERSVYYSKKRNARLTILARKATEAGLTCTKAEIDAYMKKK